MLAVVSSNTFKSVVLLFRLGLGNQVSKLVSFYRNGLLTGGRLFFRGCDFVFCWTIHICIWTWVRVTGTCSFPKFWFCWVAFMANGGHGLWVSKIHFTGILCPLLLWRWALEDFDWLTPSAEFFWLHYEYRIFFLWVLVIRNRFSSFWRGRLLETLTQVVFEFVVDSGVFEYACLKFFPQLGDIVVVESFPAFTPIFHFSIIWIFLRQVCSSVLL